MQRKTPNKHGSKLIVTFVCVAVMLILFLLGRFLPQNRNEEMPPLEEDLTISEEMPEQAEATPAEPVEESVEATESEMVSEPESTEPVMLPKLAELYGENPDLCGWIQIEDTMLDYPVMYTPEDPEKYLRQDFDETFSVGGLPFVDAHCSLDPESDNLIIYGHNMNNGSMFQTLMEYTDEAFWKEHPTVLLSTLYEEREYEIAAAFYDRVYYVYEDVFKFYQFIDAENEENFNEAMAYFKENSLYDTGVTAEYGDRLLTLVTCSYHHEHGRFVVVAREHTD